MSNHELQISKFRIRHSTFPLPSTEIERFPQRFPQKFLSALKSDAHFF